MVKLANKKIKWCIDQVIKGKKSTKSVTNLNKVSQRRIQQLVKLYKDTGDYPHLNMNMKQSQCIGLSGWTYGEYCAKFYAQEPFRSYDERAICQECWKELINEK
jgi:hypothetical protein